MPTHSDALCNLLEEQRHLNNSEWSLLVYCCGEYFDFFSRLEFLNCKEFIDDDFEIIMEALQNNTTINFLELWLLDICSPSTDHYERIPEVVKLIECNKTIVHLGLSINALGDYGDYGCIAIANALKANETITELDLTQNGIKEGGAIAIADCLKTNTALTKLDLDNNLIGNDGTIAIASSLATNSSLNSLSLVDNDLGDEFAMQFASSLAQDQTGVLTSIDLRSNKIGNVGGIAIASVMAAKNTSLEQIDLGRNCLGDVEAIQLASEARRNIISAASRNDQVEVLLQSCQRVEILYALLLTKPDLCYFDYDNSGVVAQGNIGPTLKRKNHHDVASICSSNKFCKPLND